MNLDEATISDAAGVYGIKIIVSLGLQKRILDNNRLKWHIRKGAGWEERYLTLKEIYRQLEAKGYSGVIYVWEEGPLKGTIYMCGNYRQGQWVKHGTTRGYA